VRRTVAPVAAAVIGLAASLAATLHLHRSAAAALDRVLEERLRGAGETAAELVSGAPPAPEPLRAIMRSNELEGAYVLSRSLEILADATGPSGVRADLLRVDAARAARAFAGEPSTAFTYAVGDAPIATGYFPVRSARGTVDAVLALEAGASFADARRGLAGALWIGVAVSALGAIALAAAALRWSQGEARRRDTATRAARGDTLARMAAMVAHEIRNPIGMIRGAAELIRTRSGAALGERDREALADVLAEVDRLRRLTDDFLDLAREPALVDASVDLAELAGDAARALARSHPDVSVRLDSPALSVRADPDRVRQVLANLLVNAAQSGARTVEIAGALRGSAARLEIRDDGGGVPQAVRDRLFDPFATGRPGGVGLGLAISRRIVERHGGSLSLAATGGGGSTFALELPAAGRRETP
jgi:signal transduction histidine kinase